MRQKLRHPEYSVLLHLSNPAVQRLLFYSFKKPSFLMLLSYLLLRRLLEDVKLQGARINILSLQIQLDLLS